MLDEQRRALLVKEFKKMFESFHSQLQAIPVSFHLRSMKVQVKKKDIEDKLAKIESMTRFLTKDKVFVRSSLLVDGKMREGAKRF